MKGLICNFTYSHILPENNNVMKEVISACPLQWPLWVRNPSGTSFMWSVIINNIIILGSSLSLNLSLTFILIIIGWKKLVNSFDLTHYITDRQHKIDTAWWMVHSLPKQLKYYGDDLESQTPFGILPEKKVSCQWDMHWWWPAIWKLG